MLKSISIQRTKRRVKAEPRKRRTTNATLKAAKSALKTQPLLWIPIAFGFALCLYGGYVAMQKILNPTPLVYAFVPSPNFDDRPSGATVDCLVIHATVEPTTEGTMDIFLTPSRKVSAHFVVGRDGRVVQMVPVEKRAWHAGNSQFDGASAVNNFSVGIEMVNLNNGKDPYPVEQMEAVAGIVRLLRSRYGIPDKRIVSHAQIALPAGRKNDPVGFDFEKLKEMARQTSSNDKTDLPPPSSDTPPEKNSNSSDSRF